VNVFKICYDTEFQNLYLNGCNIFSTLVFPISIVLVFILYPAFLVFLFHHREYWGDGDNREDMSNWSNRKQLFLL